MSNLGLIFDIVNNFLPSEGLGRRVDGGSQDGGRAVALPMQRWHDGRSQMHLAPHPYKNDGMTQFSWPTSIANAA